MIICVGSVFVDHISSIDTFPKKPIKVLAIEILETTKFTFTNILKKGERTAAGPIPSTGNEQ